ncbi:MULTISPECIES: haloacid dehalogenase type II [Pantoea]|jgi:2-haloacid dehalogenase|uniref:haloacid dehalogenase type II n=1 Tax=Pantoea TaxID=53335 RepID=UPI000DE28BA2|nr:MULTISPECIES: haloacid dehalogenase type II [Pantoea]MDJ0021753.1 haloacid dehalogenase type II [Pantoea eucrina]RBO11760.1 haloacid dehalogenase type II [Pantoea sp. 3_1284]
MKESTLLVFDVNETLLDLTYLDDFFLDTFGDTQVMRQWFAEQILYSQTLTLSGRYVPFGELAVAVLKMVATIRSTALTSAQITQFQEEMAALPAHPDAQPALEKLRTAGFEMVTFTNSSAKAGKKVLAQSGLAPFFSQQFSVELSGCFKPAAAAYGSVSQALDRPPAALRMIATHAWDIIGAMACGWKGALLTRAGNAPLLLGEQPDICGPDLQAIAEQIIAADRRG